MEFLLRWKGYSEEDDTWTREEDIIDQEAVALYKDRTVDGAAEATCRKYLARLTFHTAGEQRQPHARTPAQMFCR